MFNTVIVGNVATNPILKTVNTANGPANVCNFNVAVNNRRNNTATFIRVSVWRGLAAVCARDRTVGREVYVSGIISAAKPYLSTRTNEYITNLELSADTIEFLQGGPRAVDYTQPQAPAVPETNYDMQAEAQQQPAPAMAAAAPAPVAPAAAMPQMQYPF